MPEVLKIPTVINDFFYWLISYKDLSGWFGLLNGQRATLEVTDLQQNLKTEWLSHSQKAESTAKGKIG